MDKIGGNKMKRAFFMTVGTGIGLNEEKIKRLAHGLLTAIIHYNPDKVIFFGSENSKATVESIKRQYYESRREKFEGYEFVKIEDIDDFYECYLKIEEKIKENRDYEIIIDYTSGTKTMTTSAAICAMLYQKKLSMVAGKRGKNGVVQPGTEVVKEQNLFAAYNKFLFDRFKDTFNNYRFEEAKRYLKQIVADEKTEYYDKIVDAYDAWDKFNHKKAEENLKGYKEKIFYNNKVFLHKLSNAKLKEEYLIPDLINNAWRRIEEGKYDDAVARLYRCIEMIAQYKLKRDYDLEPSEINIIDLRSKPIENIEKYEVKQDENGIIRLALMEDYQLLVDLKDELGKVIEDKEIKNLLQKRNLSILAHGIMPIGKANAERLLEKTIEVAKRVVENLEKKIELAKFPKL